MQELIFEALQIGAGKLMLLRKSIWTGENRLQIVTA
jgi:hypothetical protein